MIEIRADFLFLGKNKEARLQRETAEEINAFLKKHGYTKVRLIEEGYKSLLEQAGEINTDLAKITDGYDDFFDFELRKFEEEKNNNKT